VAADLLPILWIVPGVLAWWMARTLNSIRLDVHPPRDEHANDGSAQPLG
jgi:hypothetical protein